ncbi:F-box/kelch-repeat protein At1g51550-like, partial [Asparagus officinalis]|uniref:F-box/kelch-repeat protein At1g51550-like n=1 Tax=Asparagus officinalis TaxID=4686 RepID=UPI00098E333D
SDTWLLDLSNGLHSARWHQLPHICPSPPARSGHSLTWISGTLMVLFGGRGSGYEVLNDLWVFDLGGDKPKWTELKYDISSDITEMPRPRVGHSASLILGGKILIYGGEDSQRQRKDDFWLLDVNNLLRVQSTSWKKASAKEIWKKLRVEDWNPGYRSFHGACTDKSGLCIYIFGGMVDGMLQPREAYGLRFDGELFIVELVIPM